MAKYKFQYEITISHEIEVEAENQQEALEIQRELTDADVIQSFADTFPCDISGAKVSFIQ